MKKMILFSILTLISVSLFAQYDSLWAKTYGGENDDFCSSVIETSDSCYLLGGISASFGSGDAEYWLVKTDMSGDTLWTETYGGSNYEYCYSITETSDSCYLLAGITYSFGAGDFDYWIVKTDINGFELWSKTYGGAADDRCQSVIETSDSCYLLGGYTESYGAGSQDYWLIKIDTGGDTLWTKTYGGVANDRCYSIIETSDSCYLLAGYTASYGTGGYDYWLIKTDSSGDTLWTKTYGGASGDYCYQVKETSDFTYLLGGSSYSYGAGNADYWLVKTNTNGDTLWTKAYGGGADDYLRSVIITSDSSYLLGGDTYSYGAGDYDYWIVKTDTSGDTLWTKTYGGESSDCCYSVIETSDSSYLLGGYTESYGAGVADYWVIKITNVLPQPFSVIPNYDYISLDSKLLNWHASNCNVPFSYELSFNSILDTLPQSDTAYTADSLIEGQYIWFVTAVNDYGYRTQSDNTDTFWVDITSPVMTYMDLWPDTIYHGPFTVNIQVQDTLAGIDTAQSFLKYSFNDSSWSYASLQYDSVHWYSSEIPLFADTGTVKYQFTVADRSQPSNSALFPDSTEHSFRIIDLSGVTDKSENRFRIDIKSINAQSIKLTLPQKSEVSISLYDISGRSILNRSMDLPAGQNRVNLDINPGVYFIRISTPYGNHSGKILNIK